MEQSNLRYLGASLMLLLTQPLFAGTDVYFNPLTQSAATATVEAGDDGTKESHPNEMKHPWQAPAGISQTNLTSMVEIETAINQSVVRVPGLGSGASMWDMMAFDDTGDFIFIPHETAMGAGVTRYDIVNDTAVVLFSGDAMGVRGELADWSNDWGAFDPSTYTPNKTLLLGEEWSGQGRIIEVMNPKADPADIQIKELNSIPNVAHEGLRFSQDGSTLYFVDEWNSGALYKIIFNNPSDYAAGGRVYVLSVDAFSGNSALNWNDPSNENEQRTGLATWVPLTNDQGVALTSIDPFKNGVSDDCSNPNTFGGRCAADEVGATPFGRPEDMEIGRLKNDKRVIYFAATSERTVYSVIERGNGKAMVKIFANDADTPKNMNFPATTGEMNSPDNLAQDAFGNIYIIEDAPNRSNVGGDIWFARDRNSNGVAESIYHFMSVVADGAEATGMIFNPAKPTEFVVAVQHPDSTDLDVYPNGFGDAMWKFDIANVAPPLCVRGQGRQRVRSCVLQRRGKRVNFARRLDWHAK